MSHPTDEFGARVPVYVVTQLGEVVSEDSPAGREAMAAYEAAACRTPWRSIEESPFFPLGGESASWLD